MKKCLFTIAIGDRFEGLEEKLGVFRRYYAERHGYDYRVIRRLPDALVPFLEFQTRDRLARVTKLAAPADLQEYDFAVFMDVDTGVHPKAPCLSLIQDRIPRGGFGAVQVLKAEERRKYFPRWSHDYYSDAEHQGLAKPALDRGLYINSGLLTFRPREVVDRWLSIIKDRDVGDDEYLLNVYEVQDGLCYLLPEVWNVVWLYEKMRTGYHQPESSWFRILRNKMKNRLTFLEAMHFQNAFEGTHMMHCANEASKLRFLYPMANRLRASLDREPSSALGNGRFSEQPDHAAPETIEPKNHTDKAAAVIGG